MSVALSSAVRNIGLLKVERHDANDLANEARQPVFRERVAADVDSYLQKQYELLLLRPELTDPKLQRALSTNVVDALQMDLATRIAEVENQFFEKVQGELMMDSTTSTHDHVVENYENTNHLDVVDQEAEQHSNAKVKSTLLLSSSPLSTTDDSVNVSRPVAASSDIVLDWSAQTGKVRGIAAAFEKSPVRSAGLLTLGALAGTKAVLTTVGAKAAAAGATKVAASSAAVAASAIPASKVLLGTSAKGAVPMFAKLATPFVSKLFATGTTTAAGGTTVIGALLAGAGAVGGPLGLTAGITVDYLLHKGVALSSKTQFRADVMEILDATREEWQYVLEAEIARAVDELVAEHIIASFSQEPG
ncbi:unnamed protein product [Amoebophrya sp. A25]|nr:unnamed protein product [Amoebophrya sp. A25]|eukprot:GSA25T00021932001.1